MSQWGGSAGRSHQLVYYVLKFEFYAAISEKWTDPLLEKDYADR